jgi:hypothetical protein
LPQVDAKGDLIVGTADNDDINASAAIARSKISGLPTSSTDNTVARFDSTAGAIQTSGVVIDDNNRLTVATGATGGYGFASGASTCPAPAAPKASSPPPPARRGCRPTPPPTSRAGSGG